MPDSKKHIRILVVEDEPLIARDIAEFLEEEGYSVLAICYTVQSALDQLSIEAPDFCILDVNLGKGPDGISFAEYLQEKHQIPFLFLTSYTDRHTLERAKKTMPLGYISKPIQFPSLRSSIEIALHNFSNKKEPKAFSPEVFKGQLLADLTPREFELLEDIYQGKTNKQLAELHFISLSTVKTHVHRIYEKFDCPTRSELIARIRAYLQP
ncbi:MAG: response regulator transcription factor [Bacteroidota bacterium]